MPSSVKHWCKNVFQLGHSLLLCLAAALPYTPADACTTAAWTAVATASQAPLMWKNRDTDDLSNRVVYVDAKPHKYIGLADHTETTGRTVFAGINDQGFGIFNSVAYNLPLDPKEAKDQEGAIMAEALRTIASIGDFEKFLQQKLGPNLGAQTNFVVTDASGEVSIFELHNHGFKKLSVNESPKHYLVNTNFSRSGAVGEGVGYLRFERATSLIEQQRTAVDVDFIFNRLARDFGHTLLQVPSLEDLATKTSQSAEWYASVDTINRDSTASAVVIEGKIPGNPNSLATLWVLLGEPATSLAVPIWVEAGKVPLALSDGLTVPMQAESLRLKRLLRPMPEQEMSKYMNLVVLHNREGTGILPPILAAQREIIARTQEFLRTKPSTEAMASFQEQIAEEALEILKSLG
jgi:hypothetical protein